MTIDPAFVTTVRRSWSKETSADPNWRHWNPALGQCAVTALLVQDAYGGDLVRGLVGHSPEAVSHYWNRLPDGQDVDLTVEQFTPMPTGLIGVVRPRSYLMDNPDTAARYLLLLKTFLKDASSDVAAIYHAPKPARAREPQGSAQASVDEASR